MKSWTDLKLVAEPPAVAALPKDARGYPIPVFAKIMPDGTPDFTVLNERGWFDNVIKKRCAICGTKMSGLFALVGGPGSMESRIFVDGPMHKDCAEYALKACPFLAAPKFQYMRTHPEVKGVKITVNPEMSTERPEKFGLGITSGYVLQRHGQGVVVSAARWVSKTWWKNGVEQP